MKHHFRDIINGKKSNYCGGRIITVIAKRNAIRRKTGLYFCEGCNCLLKKTGTYHLRKVEFEVVMQLNQEASLMFHKVLGDE